MTAAECTVDALTPIVANIKTEIVAATVKVNALMGQDAAIIMASVDGTTQITVAALAKLVATLCIVSFLHKFLKVLSSMFSVGHLRCLRRRLEPRWPPCC